MLFASVAHAQTAAASAGPSAAAQFIPLILIFAVFYFLMIRPQQKKLKAHQEMVNNLKRGDNVVTSGGILGKVTKVNDDRTIEVEIAADVTVVLTQESVSELREKPAKKATSSKSKTPAKKASKTSKATKKTTTK